MRKVFIDAGANVGQSIEAFYNHYPNSEEYEIHSFEASQSPDVLNPLNAAAENFRDKTKGVKVYNKAIWIHDGTVDFYDSGDESSSIMFRKARMAKIKDNSLIKREVDCVDIGNWIKNNFTKEDHIVLKLDIEGGEYSVIPKMLEDGALEYVDKLFCEIHGLKCHYNFVQSMSLINIANEATGGLYIWSAQSYGKKEEAKYDEASMISEYKKWHTKDIRGAYSQGTMDSVNDITEEELIKMINIMIDNKVWIAKIKGTRYIMDISNGMTDLQICAQIW